MLTYARHNLQFQISPVSVILFTAQRIWYTNCVWVWYLQQCRISHFVLEW